MIILIVGALGIFAFLLLMKVLWTKKKPKLSTNVIVATSAVMIGSLGILMASGRLHWLAAAGTALLPFLRQAFFFLLRPISLMAFQNFARGGGGNPFAQMFGDPRRTSSSAGPNVSETSTDEINMSLDHSTGEMSGNVLQGQFKGRELESLAEREIVELYNTVSDDSKRLLTAYIQRYHPNLAAGNDAGETPDDNATSSISPERARRILGVDEGASRDEIVEAHRRLMQRNHPDRGGSEYIASEINQAKQVLLDLL